MIDYVAGKRPLTLEKCIDIAASLALRSFSIPLISLNGLQIRHLGLRQIAPGAARQVAEDELSFRDAAQPGNFQIRFFFAHAPHLAVAPLVDYKTATLRSSGVVLTNSTLAGLSAAPSSSIGARSTASAAAASPRTPTRYVFFHLVLRVHQLMRKLAVVRR